MKTLITKYYELEDIERMSPVKVKNLLLELYYTNCKFKIGQEYTEDGSPIDDPFVIK